jgi:SAM-dependent methyltransferase
MSGTAAWKGDNDRIRTYYANLLRQHGPTPLALDWGGRASQEKRFGVLAAIAPLHGTRVLDVGCGLADFYDFLQRRGIDVGYTGHDLNPEAIAQARERYPALRLEAGDLMDLADSKAFDYVFASGLFYLRQASPWEYLEASVRKLFGLSRRGLAFNSLSTLAPRRDASEFYADPARVLAFCLTLTPHVTLRHDYLPNDFTCYLYGEGQ